MHGRDAIATGIIMIWIESNLPDSRLEQMAADIGHYNFTNYSPDQIGKVMFQFNDLYGEFLCDIETDRLGKLWDLAATNKVFFCKAVGYEIGKKLVLTKWWQNNLDKMDKNKLELKKIRSVHNT